MSAYAEGFPVQETAISKEELIAQLQAIAETTEAFKRGDIPEVSVPFGWCTWDDEDVGMELTACHPAGDEADEHDVFIHDRENQSYRVSIGVDDLEHEEMPPEAMLTAEKERIDSTVDSDEAIFCDYGIYISLSLNAIAWREWRTYRIQKVGDEDTRSIEVIVSQFDSETPNELGLDAFAEAMEEWQRETRAAEAAQKVQFAKTIVDAIVAREPLADLAFTRPQKLSAESSDSDI